MKEFKPHRLLPELESWTGGHIVRSMLRRMSHTYPLRYCAIEICIQQNLNAEIAGIEQNCHDWGKVSEIWRFLNGALKLCRGHKKVESITTSLHVASEYGLLSRVRDQLDRGVDTNSKAGRFLYALISTSEYGHRATMRLLLKMGAQINLEDEFRRTALSYAAQRGNETIVKLLLDGDTYMRAAYGLSRGPLSYASCCGHEETVKLLLEGGAHTKWK